MELISCILGIFQKYVIFAQFQPTPLSLKRAKPSYGSTSERGRLRAALGRGREGHHHEPRAHEREENS